MRVVTLHFQSFQYIRISYLYKTSFPIIIHLIQFKYHFNSHFKTVYISNQITSFKSKMKLLHLIIKLLNFQNFQLSKFIYSLKFIKIVKIHFSQHLENATESYIQNISI